MKPFVKWVGGKRQLLPILETKIDTSKTKYFEPFVGAGALLFDVLEKYNFKEYYIGDTNSELINAYNCIKNNCDELCAELTNLKINYDSSLNKEELYYTLREEFNNSGLTVRNAALLIALNKTCFNGLHRINTKGKFNASFGKFETMSIDIDNLKDISKALQNVNIHNCSYEDFEDAIDSNSFVYLDPPYRPLATVKSEAKALYTKSHFNDNNQIMLAEFCRKIDLKGSKFVLSNANTEDGFFETYYNGFNIEKVSANRRINCDGKGRGKIKELMITN